MTVWMKKHYNEETDQEEGPCKIPQIPRPMPPGRLCESLSACDSCILEATFLWKKPCIMGSCLKHELCNYFSCCTQATFLSRFIPPICTAQNNGLKMQIMCSVGTCIWSKQLILVTGRIWRRSPAKHLDSHKSCKQQQLIRLPLQQIWNVPAICDSNISPCHCKVENHVVRRGTLSRRNRDKCQHLNAWLTFPTSHFSVKNVKWQWPFVTIEYS